jgi:hypothetical protein
MKKAFSVSLLCTFLIALIFSCNQTSISEARFNSAFNNLGNCLKGCDEKEKACIANLDRCLRSCDEWLTRCGKDFPVGSAGWLKCMEGYSEKCTGELFRTCFAEFNRCMEEVRECRRTCSNKFPLEVKEK